MGRWALSLVMFVAVPDRAGAQPWPAPHREGAAALDRLLAAAESAGTISPTRDAGNGTVVYRMTDAARFGRVAARDPDLSNPKLTDAVVLRWRDAVPDQKGFWTAVLRGIAAQSQRPRTQAFAELFEAVARSADPKEHERAQGAMAKARELFRQAKDAGWEAATELEIGNLQLGAEHFNEAAAAYRRSLNLYTGALGRSHPLVSDCWRNLGNVSYRQQAYAEAVRCYREALNALGPADADRALARAACLQNLANALRAVNDDSAAAKCAEEGLTIIRDRLGPDAPTQLPFLEVLALVYLARAEPQTAIQTYQRALQVARKAYGTNSAAAAKYLRLWGDAEGHRGQAKEALFRHEEALAILRKLPAADQQDLPALEEAIGGDHCALGDGAKAAGHFQEAIAAYEKRGTRVDRANAALLLSRMARLADERETPGAAALHRRAIETMSASLGADNPLLRLLHRSYGLHLLQHGPVPEAVGQFKRVQELAQKAGNDLEWAEATELLGEAYRQNDDLAAAEPVFRQAIAVYRKAQHPKLAACYGSLAGVYIARNEYDEAARLLQLAVDLQRKVSEPDHPYTLSLLSMLGTAQLAGARHAEAERTLQELLDLTRRKYGPGAPEIADRLRDLARVSVRRNQLVRAASSLEDALAVYRRKPELNRGKVIATLDELGVLCTRRRNFVQATQYYREAVEEVRKGGWGDTLTHAEVLMHWADAASAAGDRPEAEQRYLQALHICRRVYGPYHKQSLSCVVGLATLRDDAGDVAGALRWTEEGLAALRTAQPKSPAGEAAADLPWRVTNWTAHLLGLKAALLLKKDASTATCREALRLLEEGGQVIDRRRSEERISAAGKLEVIDRLGIEHIMTRLVLCERLNEQEPAGHWGTRALRACEEVRARVFLEQLGKARASQIGDLPEALAGRERELARDLRRLDREFSALEVVPLDRRDPAKVEPLLKAQRQAERNMDELQRTIAREHPRVAALRRPNPCSLEEARACLRTDEVAVLYVCGRALTYALVVRGKSAAGEAAAGDQTEGVAIVPLPGSDVLGRMVRTLVDPRVLKSDSRCRALGAQLFDLLLKPLAPHIRGKDLVLAPDGVLWEFPFELLVEGRTEDSEGRYLIETRQVRYTPSMTVLHLIDLWEKTRKATTEPLWALGDPIFSPDDKRAQGDLTAETWNLLERYAQRGRGDALNWWRRLPATRTEVQAIAALHGAGKDDVVLDAAACEQVLKTASEKGILARKRYVHLATHGILGVGLGRQPSLVLSLVGNDGKEQLGGVNDGFLTLEEVTHLKLNADLVVLSACETGRGDLRPAEGVIGLSRAFLYAGSRGVVCSLWKVDDERTAALMEAMYKHLKEGKPSAEALTLARRELMAGRDPRDGEPRGLEPLVPARRQLIADKQAPYYWAPFILIGR